MDDFSEICVFRLTLGRFEMRLYPLSWTFHMTRNLLGPILGSGTVGQRSWLLEVGPLMLKWRRS